MTPIKSVICVTVGDFDAALRVPGSPRLRRHVGRAVRVIAVPWRSGGVGEPIRGPSAPFRSVNAERAVVTGRGLITGRFHAAP